MMLEKVRGFFYVEEKEDLHARAPGQGSDESHHDEIQKCRAEFEKRLKEICTERSNLLAGRIHFVNMAKIRAKFGERWKSVAPKAHAIIESVLKAHLGKKDVFGRLEEDTYAIAFDNLPPDEAKLTCIFLSQEILKNLMGEEGDLSLLDVMSSVKRIDGGIGFERVDLVSAVQAALSKAEGVKITKDSLGRSTMDRTDIEGIAVDLEKILGQAVSADTDDKVSGVPTIGDLLDILQSAEAEIDALPPYDDLELGWGDEEDDNVACAGESAGPVRLPKLPVDFASKADAGESTYSVLYMTGEGKIGGVAAPELVFSYQPVWHVCRNVLSAYSAQVGVNVNGQLLFGEDIPGADIDATTVSTLDILVLRKVLTDLADTISRKDLSVLCVPVHYSTLNSPQARDRYLRLCNAVPKKVRHYLVFEVIPLSSCCWHTSFPEILSLLRRFSRAVTFRVGLGHWRFDDLQGLPLHAVGFAMNDYDLPEGLAARGLENFAAHAARCGLRSYVHSIVSLNLASVAATAGYRYVAGPAIASVLPTPRGIIPFGYDQEAAVQRRARTAKR